MREQSIEETLCDLERAGFVVHFLTEGERQLSDISGWEVVTSTTIRVLRKGKSGETVFTRREIGHGAKSAVVRAAYRELVE